MKKSFRPASLLLYFLTIIVSLFLGMSFAGLMDAGKGQGLAAGAIVLGYGVIAAVVGLIISIFVAAWGEHTLVVRLNKILGILLLLFLAFFIYRIATLPEPDTGNDIPAKPPQTKPMSFSPTGEKQNNKHQPGMGFFRPNIFDSSVLYFYNSPDWEKTIMEHTPIDSVVFEKNEIGGYSIRYAPPWLVPEYMKLDYDMILFKVMAISQEYCRIEGNKDTNKEIYIDQRAGSLYMWPEFLLTVSTIESMHSSTNPIRIKPLEQSSEVDVDYTFLKPVEVREDWVRVLLLADDRSSLTKGWIRWQKGGKILVGYSIFS